MWSLLGAPEKINELKAGNGLQKLYTGQTPYRWTDLATRDSRMLKDAHAARESKAHQKSQRKDEKIKPDKLRQGLAPLPMIRQEDGSIYQTASAAQGP